MTEPYPTYHTTSTPTPVFTEVTAVALTPQTLEDLERQLISALKAVWKAQDKRKKIIDTRR